MLKKQRIFFSKSNVISCTNPLRKFVITLKKNIRWQNKHIWCIKNIKRIQDSINKVEGLVKI